MSEQYPLEKDLFAICVEDVQGQAKEQVGRELTDDEMYIVTKGIESGLGEAQWIVMRSAINDAVNDREIEHS